MLFDLRDDAALLGEGWEGEGVVARKLSPRIASNVVPVDLARSSSSVARIGIEDVNFDGITP